jgi:NAD(P)-dependent dehydrogenase (short-subunit alcohol dehydrogenase family)
MRRMAWNLDGRVVLVTGAASGIGAELARRLAGRGMRPALIDVQREPLERVAAGIRGAEYAVADVRDGEALTAAIDDLAERLGGIDLCVANAGIAAGGPMRLFERETFEDVIEVNLLGVWRTARAALPHVLERRGHLLLIASGAAVLAPPGLGAYSASKAGVEAFGRSLRAEVRRHGVTVGVAYYLFLNTPMVQAGDASPIFQASRSRMPSALGRTRPLEPAIDVTVAGIERRARWVVHPRLLLPVMGLRGVLDNPLTDRLASQGIPDMEQRFEVEAQRIGADAAARSAGRMQGAGAHPGDGERPERPSPGHRA